VRSRGYAGASNGIKVANALPGMFVSLTTSILACVCLVFASATSELARGRVTSLPMSQKRTVPTTGVTATSQLRICETAAERKAQTAKAHFKYPEVLILPRVWLPLRILPSGATPDTLWEDAGSRCLRTPAKHLGHRAQQRSGCAPR
jgi:hypothetical protein